jgi:hypothetical protein
MTIGHRLMFRATLNVAHILSAVSTPSPVRSRYIQQSDESPYFYNVRGLYVPFSGKSIFNALYILVGVSNYIIQDFVGK